MWNKDERDGKIDEATGKVKQAVGDLTNDPDLKAEGQDDEAAGKAQAAAGQVRRKVGDAIESVAKAVGTDHAAPHHCFGAALWRRWRLLLRPWCWMGRAALRRRTSQSRADRAGGSLGYRQYRWWRLDPLNGADLLLEGIDMRHFVKTTALLGVMLLALASGGAAAQVSLGITIGRPPTPRVERVQPVSPGVGYVWTAGYWYPVGSRYTWHGGYWTRPPYEGARWVAPHHDGKMY